MAAYARVPGRGPGHYGVMEPRHSLLVRIGIGLGGTVLVIVGIVLLVLPGPGLLLVLAGLLVLAQAFPQVEKYVDPTARRARKAMEDSVSSPLRIAGSVLVGLALVGTGVAWGLRVFDWLPLPGWSTGSSLILSGLIALGLVAYSLHRVRTHPSAGPRSDGSPAVSGRATTAPASRGPRPG